MHKSAKCQEVNADRIVQATQNARQSIEYGTKIVGGVTPGKYGEHLGLPVLPSMRAVSGDSLWIYDAPFTIAAMTERVLPGQGAAETRCNSRVCLCAPGSRCHRGSLRGRNPIDRCSS